MSGIQVETQGSVGYLTLSKPETLNAITQEMIDELHQGLRQHEENVSVKIIVLRSASERAFCAGGDMKRIRQYALDKEKEPIKHFFTQEYALNLAIANCSKPYVSIIDGVAMGGGLGLSVHGHYVVVTEHALMAMPESRIGFFPDVGASHFLQNLPYNCGNWLALTAMSVKGAQAVQAGLATHHIKRDQLPALLSQLENWQEERNENQQQATDENSIGSALHSIQQCLDSVSQSVVDNDFTTVLQQREHWFSSDHMPTIRNQLSEASANNEDALKLLTLIEKGSPHSYALTLTLLADTKGMSLENCLTAELALSVDAAFHPDLAEGVRAVLVDKDHKAAWQ